MVRVDSSQAARLCARPHSQAARLCARPHSQPFEMRGVKMTGWLCVDAEGLRTKRQLEPWVSRGVTYARSLPPKG